MTGSDICVVVTCYDLGRTLDEALASVSRQTRPPHEVVVVDDGSSDVYTRQVLARVDGTVRVISTPNRGVSAARNLGIASTSAPYIVVLDADDWLDDSYFEQAAGRLDHDRSIAFVSCGMRCFGDTDDVWTPPLPNLPSSLVQATLHVSTMFRRELWETVGGFDESFRAYEEMDFWARVLEQGFSGHILPDALLHYRVRPGSMARRALRPDAYGATMRQFHEKHKTTVLANLEKVLLETDRFLLEQREHHDRLIKRRRRLEQRLGELDEALNDAAANLASHGQSRIDFGDLRRITPVSSLWGIDRGMPLDRYYIEAFLREHCEDIKGVVLEVKDAGYTRVFGGTRVLRSDVLDIDPSNANANIVADLAAADTIASDRYDCVLLTQTLSFIFEPGRALAHVFRILKPGGILLCTVPAVGRIDEELGPDRDFWRFAEASVRRLFAQVFSPENFEVRGFGNVLASAAFLYGLGPNELATAELDAVDSSFPVVYAVRAVKPAGPVGRPALGPKNGCRESVKQPYGAILMYHRVSKASNGMSNPRLSARGFRAHLEHLRDAGYSVVALNKLVRDGDLCDRTTPRIAITFDDGYAEVLTEAAPILSELGMPATFFIVGESLDSPCEYWWDTVSRVFSSTSEVPNQLRVEIGERIVEAQTVTVQGRRLAAERVTEALYPLDLAHRQAALAALLAWSGCSAWTAEVPRPLNRVELLKLAQIPGMSIGAHTEHHLWLPEQPLPDRARELSSNKERLEFLLGTRVTSLAYPYGAVDAATAALAGTIGFTEAVTTEPRGVKRADSPLQLPRLDVGACDVEAFAELLRCTFEAERHEPTLTTSQKTLVAGWFSFERGGATAGDLRARDLACEWLEAADEPYDVALAAPFDGGVDWRQVDPAPYSKVVFVCGPFGRREELEMPFLERFALCQLIGLNLSMLEPLEAWDPFDVLLERDSNARARPDVVFAAPNVEVPVIGVCLVEAYENGRTDLANAAIERLVSSRDVARIRIDTRLDMNEVGLKTASEIETLISRVDVLVTTRLHGLVFALKHGVPVIALDPHPGGGKICRQGRTIGWPLVFAVDDVTDRQLQDAFAYCLSENARADALACAARAKAEVGRTREAFVESIRRLQAPGAGLGY